MYVPITWILFSGAVVASFIFMFLHNHVGQRWIEAPIFAVAVACVLGFFMLRSGIAIFTVSACAVVASGTLMYFHNQKPLEIVAICIAVACGLAFIYFQRV